METLFFSGWGSLGRTAIIAVLAYVGLVVMLRVSGPRTLSKMNAFDFVVTIAIGSTLATMLLNKQVALLDGLLAFALLIGLQYAVTWASARSQASRRVVTGEPILLLRDGAALPGALRRARVTEDELRAAVRAAGHGDVASIAAVVMETDGSFSVIAGRSASPTALRGVRGGGTLGAWSASQPSEPTPSATSSVARSSPAPPTR